MKKNLYLYPKIWDLKRTDKNNDHRRVPNLMTFFSRKDIAKSKTKNFKGYIPEI